MPAVTPPLKIDTASVAQDKVASPVATGDSVDSAAVKSANGASSPTTSTTEQSPVDPRKSARSRARTSSSGMLSLLTSRQSVASPTSTEGKGSLNGPPSPSLDRAALEKPRGKYKSGANWNVPGLSIDMDEPFMETADATSPTEREDDEAKRLDLEAEQSRQMLEAGGTAAAKAHASRSSIGAPYFPSQHRQAAQHAHLQAAQAAQRAFQVAPGSGAPLMPGAPAMPPISVGPRSPAAYQRPAIGPNGERSTPGGVDPKDPFVAEAAQRILAAARAQAAGAPVHAPASHAAFAARVTPSPEEPVPEGSTPLATMDSTNASGSASGAESKSTRSVSPAPSTTAKATKRRTFLGFGMGKADKAGGKQSSSKSSSRRASRADLSMSSNASTTDMADTMSIASGYTDGTHTGSTTPNGGTVGRRRRYKDTRQLDLLAAELAAETLLGQQYDAGAYGQPAFPGTLTPEARRASMMSVLGGANNGSVASLGGAGGLGGSALLAPLAPLTAPQPAFANASYGSQGSPGSSRNSSPRVGGVDLPRFDARRSASSLGLGIAGSPTGSPYATQKAKLTGLPSDMLTGLGDGPYPSLPHGGALVASASVDPFGIPTTSNESPYDVSTSYANRVNVYHSPSSRRLSSSSGGTSGNAFGAGAGLQMTSSSAPYPPSSAKRSVLTMSMHSPETESQGLTKPMKSGRTTPFASRAGSRTVTPKTSMGGLREKAAAAASANATSPQPTATGSAQQPVKEKKEELNKVAQVLREQVKSQNSATPSPSPPLVEAPAPVPVPTPVPASAPEKVAAATPAIEKEKSVDSEQSEPKEELKAAPVAVAAAAAAPTLDTSKPSQVPPAPAPTPAQPEQVSASTPKPPTPVSKPEPEPPVTAASLKPAISLKTTPAAAPASASALSPSTSSALSPSSASIGSANGTAKAGKPKLVSSSSFSRATARLSFFGGKKEKPPPSPASSPLANGKLAPPAAAASPTSGSSNGKGGLGTPKGSASDYAKPNAPSLANGAKSEAESTKPYVPSSRPQPTSPQQGQRQALPSPSAAGQQQQRPPQQQQQQMMQRPPQQQQQQYMNGRPPMQQQQQQNGALPPPGAGVMRAGSGAGFVHPPPPGMMQRPPPGALPGQNNMQQRPPPPGMMMRPPPQQQQQGGMMQRPPPMQMQNGVARPPQAAGQGQHPIHPMQQQQQQARPQPRPTATGAGASAGATNGTAAAAPPSAAPKQPTRRPVAAGSAASASDGALAAGPKSGSKLSRFMARFTAKTSAPPSGAGASTGAGVNGAATTPTVNGGSGSSTPRDRTASLPAVPGKSATSASASKTPSLAPPPVSKQMTPSPSQEDLRVARAYLNPEMSAHGFGTRSAYVSSSSGGSGRTPSRDSAAVAPSATRPDSAGARGGTPSSAPTSAYAAKNASAPPTSASALASKTRRDGSVEPDEEGSRASASASSRSTDDTSAAVATPGETPTLSSDANGTLHTQEEEIKKAQLGGIAYTLPLKAAVA